METKVLDAYRRYLKTLEDKNTDFGGNYKAMKEYISSRCTGADRTALFSVLTYETVKAVKGHGIKCVSKAGDGWDRVAVQELYTKLNSMQTTWDKRDTEDVKERLAVQCESFFKLVYKNADKPWLQLYMYQCYSVREFGKWFITPKYLRTELAYVNALLEGKTPKLDASEEEDLVKQLSAPVPQPNAEDFIPMAAVSDERDRAKRTEETIRVYQHATDAATTLDELDKAEREFISTMRSLHKNFDINNKRSTYMIPMCDAVILHGQVKRKALEDGLELPPPGTDTSEIKWNDIFLAQQECMTD